MEPDPKPDLKIRLRKSKSLKGPSNFQRDPDRPKKSKRAKLLNRLSIQAKSLSFDVSADHEKDEIDLPKVKISIGDNVSFAHKEHVRKEDANQFLVKLLKMRQEHYLQIHDAIRESITCGYMYLRPPSHKVSEFEQIIPLNKRKKRQGAQKHGTVPKAHKFWVELCPQPVSAAKEKEIQDEKSGRKRKKKKTRKKEKVKLVEEPLEQDVESIYDTPYSERQENVTYFAENLPASQEKAKKEKISLVWDPPKGVPDYLFYVYSSEYKTAPSQLLAIIPLNDVKISPIGPLEFSISYVNRLPNTHCFRVPSPELAHRWMTTLSLATQQKIENPFPYSRSRSSSISHGISMLSKTLVPRTKTDINGGGGISRSESNTTLSAVDEEYHYYKPLCRKLETLRREGAFSDCVTFQEVYSASSTIKEPGWRILGGTIEDIITWCILLCERTDKPNIDVIAFLNENSDEAILKHAKLVWASLKLKIAPKYLTSSRKRSRLKNQKVELVSEDDEYFGAVVLLEKRLINFFLQWARIRANTSDSGYLKEELAGLIEFATSACDQEKLIPLLDFIDAHDAGVAEKNIPSPLPIMEEEEQGLPLIPSLATTATHSFSKKSPPASTTSLDILSRSVSEFAEQLTVLEVGFIQKVKQEEFSNLAWDKTPERATNLLQLIEHYNKMTLWVVTEILTAKEPKQQSKLISFFISVAHTLYESRNYASCAQILAGISNRAVQRLKKVQKILKWKTVQHYEELNNFFDPGSGYSYYRNKMDHSAPTIPFIMVHLRTLTLIEEGNPKMLDESKGVISFARAVMYFECVEQIHVGDPAYLKYPIEPIPALQNMLRNVVQMDEEQLYDLSVALEPLRGGLKR